MAQPGRPPGRTRLPGFACESALFYSEIRQRRVDIHASYAFLISLSTEFKFYGTAALYVRMHTASAHGSSGLLPSFRPVPSLVMFYSLSSSFASTRGCGIFRYNFGFSVEKCRFFGTIWRQRRGSNFIKLVTDRRRIILRDKDESSEQKAFRMAGFSLCPRPEKKTVENYGSNTAALRKKTVRIVQLPYFRLLNIGGVKCFAIYRVSCHLNLW